MLFSKRNISHMTMVKANAICDNIFIFNTQKTSTYTIRNKFIIKPMKDIAINVTQCRHCYMT